MYYESDTGYYEMSAMDELVNEFQEKCKKLLLNDVNSEISAIKESNECLRTENEKLRTALAQAEKTAKELDKTIKRSSFMEVLFNNLKDNISNSKDKKTKEANIAAFCSLVLKRDYYEKIGDNDAPLWITLMTMYYSNRDKVIELLKMFNAEMPRNTTRCRLPIDWGIEKFRLPVDWTEKELNIFFNTMDNHANCNGCTYQSNLRYWGTSSLDDVETQCCRTYSEIPWQYVLRNPLLKNKKYLTMIGQNAYKGKYNGNWSKFWRIDEFIDLSEDEIKTILSHINVVQFKKDEEFSRFVLKHLKFVEDDNFLERIYNIFKGSYDFTYKGKILDMPYKYILRWVCEYKDNAVKFVNDNKDKFTEEQRKELLTKALNL